MAGGYKVPKSGVDALVEEFKNGRRQQSATRSAASIKSAVVTDAASGATTSFTSEGVVSSAADGTAVRLADGVAEVQTAPDAPWVPLEQVILEQVVPEPYIPPAPTSSPTPATLGGLKQVYVRWDALVGDGPFLYELHVSDAPFTPTPGDPATLAMETASTLVSVKALPDLTPFEYDTDYYFRLFAKTLGGPGPVGGQATGRMDRAAMGDLAANSVTAENLSSIITFSTLFRTAESGRRGEWDSDSLRFFDAANNQTARISGSESFFSGLASLARLETGSATLGGETVGPPGGTYKVGSAIVQNPALPLDHLSDTVAKISLAGPGNPVFTDAAAAKGWRIAQRNDGTVAIERLSLVTGASEASVDLFTTPTPLSIVPAAMSTDRLYVYDSTSIRAFARPTATTFTAAGAATVAMPAAPGTGGYGADVPIIGVQRSTGHVLIAHRVQGAQNIAGLDFADREVMVRRFTPSVSGTALSLALVQTIRTGGLASGQLASVLMDNTSGTFDVPTSSGNTAMVVSCVAGFTPFDQNHFIYLVPNTGTVVSAPWSGGAFTWYGQNTGLFWDGAAFWGTTKAGDTIEKYSNSSTIATPVFHGYTFWNGTQETKLSPVVNRAFLARRVSRWTIPALPAGVTQVRLYAAAADSRVRYERIGTFAGAAGSPLTIIQNPIAPPTGNATNPPPAASNFVNGASYRIYDDFGNEWTGLGAVTLPQLETRVGDSAKNRANHTGSPTAAWSNGSQRITDVATGTAATDAVNKGQLDAVQERYRTTLTPATTSIPVGTSASATTLPTLSQTITVPSTAAEYEVTLECDAGPAAGAGQLTINLWVDSTIQTRELFYNAQPGRYPGAKTWTVTGLFAGSHTFSFRAYAGGAAGLVVGTHTHCITRRVR